MTIRRCNKQMLTDGYSILIPSALIKPLSNIDGFFQVNILDGV